MPTEPIQTNALKRHDFVGKGALIQLAGIATPALMYVLIGNIGIGIGLVCGAIIFTIGSFQSSRYICGNCKNPLASKEVSLCPVCKAEIK